LDDPDSQLAAKYFVQRREIAYVARAFHRDPPLHTWRVRFFKPLEREEMQVYVDPESGSIFRFYHILPEDQPGAELSPDAARELAAHSRGLPSPNGFDLVESKSEKRKARRDYTLVFEAPPGDARNLDEARFRIGVRVAGGRVASFSPFWKLPESFERARSQRYALWYVLRGLRLAVIVTLVLLGLWILVDRTRRRAFRWVHALRLAAPFGLVTLVGTSLAIPLQYSQYPTAYSLGVFEAITIVSLFTSALAWCLAFACGMALILASRPDAAAVFHSAARRLCAVDAIFAAGTAVMLGMALDRVQWLLIDRFHSAALLAASAHTAFATLSPAVFVIASTCQEALLWLALLVLIAYLAERLERWPGLAILGGLVAAAGFVPATVHTPGEFFLYYAIRLLYLAAAVLFVRYLVRENYLAYLLIAWALLLVTKSMELLSQPAVQLRLQAGILIALLLATVAWTLAPAWGSRRSLAK
jgi:hypothetical protein